MTAELFQLRAYINDVEVVAMVGILIVLHLLFSLVFSNDSVINLTV
jgi:hypothetical protein